MKKALLIITLLFTGIFLVSCEDDSNLFNGDTVDIETVITLSTGQKAPDGTDITEEKKVVETVYKNPSRIAILELAILDTLDYIGLNKLGINELATTKSYFNDDLDKYSNSKYPNVGTLQAVNIEEIVKFNPQVVFLGTRSKTSYQTIKEILPSTSVLVMEMPTNTFVETSKNNIKILQKIFDNNKTEFDILLNRIDEEVVRINSLIDPNKTTLFLSVSDKNFKVFGETGRFSLIYNVFNFKPALFDNEISDKTHGEQVNGEYIASINPDYIFVLDDNATKGKDSSISEVLRSLPASINAVKQNKVLTVDGFSWYMMPGGYRSFEYIIKDIEEMIGN